MNKDCTVWLTYHDDGQVASSNLQEDEYHVLLPVHKDAKRKNINFMHPVMSEIVTMWYVWKNKLRSDIVGFEHYHRHLNIARYPKKGECGIYAKEDFGRLTIYKQYSLSHDGTDMDLMLQVLDAKYGGGNAYSDHIINSHVLITNCCFLMQWSDFNSLCKYLFPLLEQYSEKVGIEPYSENSVACWRQRAADRFGEAYADYQCRVLGFLAERLISAWIVTHLNPY